MKKYKDGNGPANQGRRKGFLAGIGLLLFSSLLAVGLLEAMVRIISPSDVPWQRHPVLGHSHVPNKKGIYSNKGYSAPFRFNSEGWRDREHSIEKPDGAFRVLVLGDSFTEGLQLPVEETYCELLETRLNQDRSRPFEVLNTGVGAFSTDQEYLALKHYWGAYHPDLIVLAFCVENDTYGNLLELRGDPYKPYFSLDDGGRLVLEEFTLPRDEGVRTFLRNHLRLYMFAKKRLSSMTGITSLLMKLGILRDSNFTQKDELGIYVDYRTHQAHYSPAFEKAWEITKELLLAIRGEAASLNAGFLVVLINYDVLVHDDLWREALETYPHMADVDWDLGKPNRLLAQFCGNNGIELLDLLPAFRKEAVASNERLHLPVDGHWNRKGNALAADLIFRKIEGAGMIPAD